MGQELTKKLKSMDWKAGNVIVRAGARTTFIITVRIVIITVLPGILAFKVWDLGEDGEEEGSHGSTLNFQHDESPNPRFSLMRSAAVHLHVFQWCVCIYIYTHIP